MTTVSTVRIPRDAIEQTVGEIWEEVLGVAPIDIQASFLSLGGDETLAETMLDRLVDTLGRRVSLQTFLLEPTVEALAAFLEETNDTDQPAAYRMAAPSLTNTEAIAEHPPFLFVSDALSARLARALGTDRACYRLPYVAEGRPVLKSIEATAASCLSTLRSLQPGGPYHLGGFCLGALVAFEMAGRLRAEGESVASLILVAPRPWSHRWLTRRRVHLLARICGMRSDREMVLFCRLTELVPRWEARWRSYVARAASWLRRPLREKLAIAIRKVGRGVSSAGRPLLGRPPEGKPKPPVSAKVHARRAAHRLWRKVYRRVNRCYVLGTYPGRISVLWGTDEPLDRPGYPVEVWRETAAEIDLHVIPGGHVSCITRHVATAVERVRACLDGGLVDSRRATR